MLTDRQSLLAQQGVAVADTVSFVAATTATNPITVSLGGFADINGLSVSVTTSYANELLLFCLRGMAYAAAGFNAYVQWTVDGVAVAAPTASFSGNAQSVNVGSTRMYQMVAGGIHTIKVQGNAVTSAWALYDGGITVTRFLG